MRRPASRPSVVRGVATVGGVGRFPIAPGTAGSAVGVLIYAGAYRLGGAWPPLFVFVVLLGVAIWSAGAYARSAGRSDPPEVVIDEVVGQLLALLGAPLQLGNLAAGFLLFRIFDIMKVAPVRRLERLPGGWGIVADDLLAGAFAWVVMLLLRARGWL